jgi:hypothetical protein
VGFRGSQEIGTVRRVRVLISNSDDCGAVLHLKRSKGKNSSSHAERRGEQHRRF